MLQIIEALTNHYEALLLRVIEQIIMEYIIVASGCADKSDKKKNNNNKTLKSHMPSFSSGGSPLICTLALISPDLSSVQNSV